MKDIRLKLKPVIDFVQHNFIGVLVVAVVLLLLLNIALAPILNPQTPLSAEDQQLQQQIQQINQNALAGDRTPATPDPQVLGNNMNAKIDLLSNIDVIFPLQADDFSATYQLPAHDGQPLVITVDLLKSTGKEHFTTMFQDVSYPESTVFVYNQKF